MLTEEGFTHEYNARNNKKIMVFVDRFGYKGYFYYWALLEIYFEEVNRTKQLEVKIHLNYILKELRIRQPKLEEILRLSDDLKIFSYTLIRPLLTLKSESTFSKYLESLRGGSTGIKFCAEKKPTEPKTEAQNKPKNKPKPKVSTELMEEFVENWNQTIGEFLGKVKVLNTSRKRHLKDTLSFYKEKESWLLCFREAYKSDFLMGRKKDWKASFDFLAKEKNFTKTIEGGFSNTEPKEKPKSFKQQEQEASESAFVEVYQRRGLNE